MSKKIIRGAIFYADLDPIVGSEQKGYRPVLILQNDIGNKYSPTTMIAPITSKEYKGRKQPTHVKVKQFDKLRPNSIILLEQVRTIDKSRIKGFIDMLDKSQMKEVEKALMISFGFLPLYIIMINFTYLWYHFVQWRH